MALGAALLSACQVPGGELGPAPSGAAVVAPDSAVAALESPETVPEPAPSPAPSPVLPPEPPPAEALDEQPPRIDLGTELAARPIPAPPEVDDDPKRLIGLGPKDLAALIGAPRMVRREATARVWQYRAADCVLDVFLYREAGSDKVIYVEARRAGTDKIPARPCLNRLLRAHLSAQRAPDTNSSAP